MRDDGFIRMAAAERMPLSVQNAAKSICTVLEGLVHSIVGEKESHFTPIIAAVFVFILALNLFGLVPGLTWSVGSVNTTAALALAAFILVQYWEIKQEGLCNHLRRFFKGSACLKPIVGAFNLAREFVRPLSLAIRLFCDLFGSDAAGAILVLMAVEVLGNVLMPIRIPMVLSMVITSSVQAVAVSMLVAGLLKGCRDRRPDRAPQSQSKCGPNRV